MILSLIFAFARDKEQRRVIGMDNKLPWHSPTDMRRFKEHTMGCPVVMGRKTYESIGRLLPGRDNIIVTRNLGYVVPGAYVETSLQEALTRANTLASSEVFVIGGEEIYKQTLDLADRLYVTEIKQDLSVGDAFFPPIQIHQFKQVYSEENLTETFAIYQRTERTKGAPEPLREQTENWEDM